MKGNATVREMLKRPITQRPASGLVESAAMIAELHALLQQKDEEIRALHENITWLRQQYEGHSQRGKELPEFDLSDIKRDPRTGVILGASVKPRRA